MGTRTTRTKRTTRTTRTTSPTTTTTTTTTMPSSLRPGLCPNLPTTMLPKVNSNSNTFILKMKESTVPSGWKESKFEQYFARVSVASSWSVLLVMLAESWLRRSLTTMSVECSPNTMKSRISTIYLLLLVGESIRRAERNTGSDATLGENPGEREDSSGYLLVKPRMGRETTTTLE